MTTTFELHQQHLERKDQPERDATQTTAEGLPFIYVDDRGHSIVRASDKELFEEHGYRVVGTVTRPDQLPCLRMSKRC